MKKTISLLLAAVLLLTACNESKNPDYAPERSQESEQQAEQSEQPRKADETVTFEEALQNGNTLSLWLANKNNREILAESGEKEIWFIADFLTEPVDGCSEILLVDDGSGEVIGTMRDSGEYALDGDKVGGDGWYSCKVMIDISEERNYFFKAVYKASNGGEIVSEVLKIRVIEPFTAEDLERMGEVDDVLKAWIKSKKFQNGTYEERAEGTVKVLEELADRGLIVKESIDRGGDVICFSYAAGGLGGVMIKDRDPRMN